MSEIIKTEALVLRTQKWQESSKIVHLFSAEEGHIRLIAKGAYRPRSPLRGVLEALNFVEVIFSKKAGRGLQILTSATLLDAFLNIREDLSHTAVAFAQLELINLLLKDHEPLQPFFQYQVTLLKTLNRRPIQNPKFFLWHFMIRLSEALGFGWRLDSCLKCGKAHTASPGPLLADVHRGGFLCPACGTGSWEQPEKLGGADWQMLSRLAEIAPQQIDELANGSEPPGTQPENLLLLHLEYHTETRLDLKSLKWYV